MSMTQILVGSLVELLTLAGAVAFYLQLRRRHRELTELHNTASRDAAIVAASGEGVLEIDDMGQVRFANPAALRLSGYELHEIVGMDYRSLLQVEEVSSREASRMGYTTDMLTGSAAMLRARHGRRRPVEYHMVPLRHHERPASLVAFRDLTERARIDVMLADMQHLARVGAWELDAHSLNINLSEAIARRAGLMRHRLPLEQILNFFADDARALMRKSMERALHEGEPFDVELPVILDGAKVWLRCIGRPEKVDGVTVRVYGAVLDITERLLAERRLSEMRDFFGATLDALPILVAHIDAQGRLTYANHSSKRLLLGAIADHVGEPLEELLVHEQYQPVLALLTQTLGDGQQGHCAGAFRIDGQMRDLRVDIVPALNKVGQRTGCFMMVTDITEMKMLESRLRQAEKMQAIGQLTGGVAHDFNNLLGVILGNLQLLERDVRDEPALARKLSTAMRAAIRGGELTRSLLAFARHQALEPVIVNLNRHLNSVVELLHRTLGDSIDFKLKVQRDLWFAQVDPGQLDNAVLNLAINARDAMPDGGQLTLSARNLRLNTELVAQHADLPPGEYVEIAVEDTGMGIATELLPLVFEPFFTTKETGKGSGLGLSIVHGFAKQSGGAAVITSQQSVGTTVALYLPRCVDDKSVDQDTLIQKPMPRGNETILVVEDDPELRATATLTLQQLGYKVKEASNGKAALRLLKEIPHIDMLFTDLIMPGGILGPELARQAQQIQPSIRVLFTTGYAGEGAVTANLPSARVLAKPYRNEELALRIRKLLDQEVSVE